MKLSDVRLHDWMFDHTEGDFVPNAIQTITHSPLNHVKSVCEIIEPTPDGIFLCEAVAEGFVKRSLRESTGEKDKYTIVCRYHADGVGGQELTVEQVKKMSEWDGHYLSKGLGYAFAQLVALAFLKQVRNDSFEGKFLGHKFEDIEKNIEIFYPSFICSEASYRKANESGISIGILKDSAHWSHYQSVDVIKNYIHNGKDILDCVIEDWLSPHDLYMSPDIIRMDELDFSWR
jgi:hypothetical protein